MSNVNNFIAESIKNKLPVNFYYLEFREGTQSKENQLSCEKYETTKLRANEFYKPITCFLDYSELNNIEIYIRDNKRYGSKSI